MGGVATGSAMLSAFVHADVVASSEFLTTRGVAASIEARALIADCIAQASAGLEGEVLETRGDGTLIRFDSAVSALGCAAAIQRDLAERRRDGSAGIEMRVGVAVVDGDDLLSGNVAASRVEQECLRGAVAIDGVTARGISAHLTTLARSALGADVYDIAVDEMARPFDAAGQSRLRSVMFTEPVGGVDVPAALAVLDVDRIVARHGGEAIDSNGLGAVVAFATCAGALDAAQALHLAAFDASLSTAGHEEVAFKIGVAVGELTSLDDVHVGRVMIEAARLMGLAEAGTTGSSEDVWRLAGGPDDLFDDGATKLKGLDEPVNVRRSRAAIAASELLPVPTPLRIADRFSLVDRENSADLLQRAWGDAHAGVLRSVVVSGPEGVGKTRLVREFVAGVHGAGAVVLFGACAEDRARPFAPIAEALGRAELIDEDVASATVGQGPLSSLFGSGDAVGNEPADRAGVAAALVEVLQRLTVQRPVVLVIDDLQWATADVTELLAQLLATAPDMRLMLLVTCRDTDVDRHHPTHRLLSATNRRRQVEPCPLDQLTPDGVAAMLESRAGSTLTEEERAFADHLQQISGGNPLYVEELVTHLVATDVLVLVDGRWSLNIATAEISVPDSVLDLMVERVGRLGGDAVSVLTAAAVIGASFDLMVLSNVLGRELLDVLEVVEAAESARLVREDDAGGACTFTDELVRSALLRDLRPTRRALVHQQVAETLEQRSPDQVEQLALHWQAAVGDEAHDKAVRYLRIAGERDMAAGAWESSVERHRRVLELVARHGVAAAIEASAETHLALGMSLRAIGDESFRAPILEAGRLAKQAERGDLLGRAAIGLMRPGAWYPEASIVDHDISAMCEAALLMLVPHDPLRARVLGALATNLAYEPDESRRVALIVEAQQLARELGDTRLIGMTLAAELITSRRPDQYGRRLELADEVSRIGRISGDHDLSITGGIFLVLEAIERADLRRARTLLDELASVVEKRRTYWPRFLVAHLDGSLLTVACDPSADAQIEAVFAEFSEHPVDAFGVWTIQMATRAMQEGRMAELILPLTKMTEDDEDADWAKKWNYATAKAHFDTGDLDAAMAAIEANPDPEFDNYWLVSVQNLGALGWAMQRRDLCERAVDLLTPYRGRLGVVGIGACIGAQVSTGLGQAYLGLGDLDMAEELLRESLAQARDMSAPFFECLAARFLAAALLERDPVSVEGVELVEAVAELATTFSFSAELDGVADLRAKHSLST